MLGERLGGIRLQRTILGGDDDGSPDDAKGISVMASVDADLILTAVAAGFAAARVVVGNPLEFVYAPDDRLEVNQRAVALLAGLVPERFTLPDDALTLEPAREWTSAALITGAVGGAGVAFERRHAVPTSAEAEELRRLAADLDDPVGYQGRGAYTGLVDDPLGKVGSIMSTARFSAPPHGFGQRWKPPTYRYPGTGATQDAAPWGLINDGSPIDGMVENPAAPGDVVGYVHGMVQAIYRGVAGGPWCTPFEIAVGTQTTKLASCLPCALFMYAAGYPPSAIHLGRGDSWLPMYPLPSDHRHYSMAVDESIRSTNLRWQLECGQLLQLGTRLLQAGSGGDLAAEHAARLPALERQLAEGHDDVFTGGNLVLDALTLPGRIADRIVRAFGGL